MQDEHEIPGAGSHAPQFELHELTGTRWSLQGELVRGPVLLAFFKVACPVCQFTFPFLDRLAKNDTVRVIGVSQDDAKSTKAFNDRFGVTFPTVLDEAKEGYPVSNGYRISTVPTVFVVETDGTISKSFEGFSKRDFLNLGKRMDVQPFLPDDHVPEFKAG